MQNKLSANLITLMNHHRIGGIQLARAINIPLSTIKNIRKGVNVNPTIETLVPLAHYFKVSLEEMISGTLSVEKISLRESGYRQNLPQVVPIISWQEAVFWPHGDRLHDLRIFTEKLHFENSFALPSEQNASELFAAPGVFLVNPDQKPAHFDYVIVHKLGLASASIKQFICDEDVSYLKSLVIAGQIAPLDGNYRLLGVVVEYRQFIASLEDRKVKALANNYVLDKKVAELQI
ncbi:MAG: helix-turn-helix transcriptional regulator [Gammaproteobacteria bacterium]